MSSVSEATEKEYWNGYYASHQQELAPPSQFAAFVASEIGRDHYIVDVGCGSGRDSLFFSRFGYQVTGIDRSESAIQGCQQKVADAGLVADFFCSGLEDLQLDSLKSIPAKASVLVYARFFLHAIPDEAEDYLLSWLLSLSERYTVRFAAEFRTDKDASLPKSTSAHYRRYINPNDFLAKVLRLGFRIDYSVEGFGFAKYKNDDAYVARYLLSL